MSSYSRFTIQTLHTAREGHTLHTESKNRLLSVSYVSTWASIPAWITTIAHHSLKNTHTHTHRHKDVQHRVTILLWIQERHPLLLNHQHQAAPTMTDYSIQRYSTCSDQYIQCVQVHHLHQVHPPDQGIPELDDNNNTTPVHKLCTDHIFLHTK